MDLVVDANTKNALIANTTFDDIDDDWTD